MKACKIDIKKTWVDVPYGVYREAIYERMKVVEETNENLPTKSVTVKEVTYFPIKVYEPGNYEITTYMVKEDEKKVFRDLMTIQEDTINQAIKKDVDKKLEYEYERIRDDKEKEIRNLPWYDRLFKRF